MFQTELTSQEARDALCSRSSPLLMDIKEELEDMEEDVKKEVESEVDDNQTENEKKDDEDEEDGVKSGNESEKDDIVEDSLDGEESRDKSVSVLRLGGHLAENMVCFGIIFYPYRSRVRRSCPLIT